MVRRRPNFTADEVEVLLASVERNTKVNMQVENKRCEFTPNGDHQTGCQKLGPDLQRFLRFFITYSQDVLKNMS